MFRRIIALLIVSSITVTYANSATQTDWSGGPGYAGPVLWWTDRFYLATDVDGDNFPGDIVLQIPAEHHVDEDFSAASCVYSEDMNGDGYMDVLGAAYGDDDITWWENEDGSGTSWTEHIVEGDFDHAISVYSEDIDGDGDMDILGAARNDDAITWWENIDGSGMTWTEHTVVGDFDGVYSVYSEDIDGDSDMDIIGAAGYADDITWWENEDGFGTSWTEHNIEGDFDGALSVYSEDINGDDDMDILGAAYYADDITWWENEDGAGTAWIEHTVEGDFDGVYSVYSEDIDGDGDMDILGAANDADDITWWENEDGSGMTWTEHTVVGDFDGARSVYSEDIDSDGDMDVLGASFTNSDITWWENIDGVGASWFEHTVDGSFVGARSVYSEDIDGDGDMDVLGAAYYGHDITWWDLMGYSPVGLLESSILDTEVESDWDYLEWNSQIPPETSVSFQVRASGDYTNMGVWSDTLTSPCLLADILNDGDRYVQYRTILETSNPDSTPILEDVVITWNPVSIEDTTDPIPSGTELLPIAPNPGSAPAIRFSLPEPASVEISIFDLSGRLICEIQRDEYSPGYHDVLLADLSPGIYLCRMISEDFSATQRFVVIE